MTSPTKILSDFIVNVNFKDLPKEAVEFAKTVTLDTIGCAFGGYVTSLGKIFIELAKDMGKKDESTIIGDGSKVSCVGAAFANGQLSDIIDFEDTYSSVGHPSAAAVPAALAVGELVEASGKDFITALVLGFELYARVGEAIDYSQTERFRQVWGCGTWQPFAAVGAAGKLFGLNKEQMATAIGITGAYSPVPSAWKYVEKPKAEIKEKWGWACLAGVFGALHAKRGLSGMTTILDGDQGYWIMAGSDRCDFEKMTRSLGERYAITATALKPYPSCRWTHSTLDAINLIFEETKIDPDEIEEIRVESLPVLKLRFMDYRPQRLADATHCLPYSVAMTVMGEKPGPNWYDKEKLMDPNVFKIADKVKAEVHPDAARAYVEEGKMMSTVEIVTKDGRRYSTHVDYPKGDPRNPMSRDEVLDKFRTSATFLMDAEKISRIIDTTDNLEQLDDVSKLADMLY